MPYFDREKMQREYPGSYMIPAMKVWKLPDNKEDKFPEMCTNGKYFAQLKKDGYWYEYEKTPYGSYLFSRNVSKTNGLLTEKSANVPHICKIFEDSDLPIGTVIIGEIYYPGKTSKNVTTIMGCLAEEAIKRQEKTGFIKFYIHDMIYYRGISLLNTGAWDRYRLLKAVCEKHNLLNNSYIELAESITNDIEEFSVQALASGEEGVVLKEKNTAYYPDKRPAWSTIKRKKMDSSDAVCIGLCDATKYYEGKLDLGVNLTGKDAHSWPYWIIEETPDLDHPDFIKEAFCEEGKPLVIKGFNYRTVPVTKGYFYGWKTAIEIGVYKNDNLVKIGTVSSGLNDELRQAFKDNPENYIGKVVELQCMEKDSKEGTLRHPFFKRFRDDKNAKDCQWTEIFDK